MGIRERIKGLAPAYRNRRSRRALLKGLIDMAPPGAPVRITEEGLVIADRSDLRECAGKLRHTDRRRQHVDQIVIHRNTASWNWRRENPEWKGLEVDALHQFHSTSKAWSFRLFPYHYFIDRDGKVSQIHDEMTVSPHAAGSNKRGVGIAFNIDGRKEAPTPAMWESAVLLCQDIMKRWPGCVIIGHSKAKRCPGPHVKVDELDREVRGTNKRIA